MTQKETKKRQKIMSGTISFELSSMQPEPGTCGSRRKRTIAERWTQPPCCRQQHHRDGRA